MNPKCNVCCCFWIPDDTDVKTSGLTYKSCKKCRENANENATPKLDYSKGKIYRIYCITGECDEVYVGSTIQSLAKRWIGHKTSSKKEKNQHKRLYQTIACVWDNWCIELIENFPCISHQELLRREGEFIRKIGTLNENIAGRTTKEYYTDNREALVEKQKTYYQKNTEDILKRHKVYRNQNAEIVAEKAKEYHKKNADSINKRHKAYEKINAVAIAERKKAYRQQNINRIREVQKAYRLKNVEKNKADRKQKADAINEYQRKYQHLWRAKKKADKALLNKEEAK